MVVLSEVFSERSLGCWLLVVCWLACMTGVAKAQAADPARVHALPTEVTQWKGDADGMLERRILRVLAPVSRTLFFIDKGAERGMTAELVRDFDLFINSKYKRNLGRRPLTVVILPTQRDALLSRLNAGYGDIAVGNLTATPARLKQADFVLAGKGIKVNEVLVTRSDAAPLEDAMGLSGRAVHVRQASSYYESLRALNGRLAGSGRAPVKLVPVPEALEDEDLMEMLGAGLIENLIVDDWKAKLWAKALPMLRVNDHVVLREGGPLGWAIRPNSPQLRALIEEFLRVKVGPQGIIPYRLTQYQKRAKTLQDPTAAQAWQRFAKTRGYFEKYADQYGFDPLLLLAQGYQESRLDQRARSKSGAIGIMQLLPQTGKAMRVGDIHQEEANIHAGVKYMSTMLDKYFADADLDEANRTLFAIAAYNAGPSRVSALRRQAAEKGVDPNQWFDHVEVLVANKVGREPTTYVRNVYKYYASYRLQLDRLTEQEQAKAKLEPNS